MDKNVIITNKELRERENISHYFIALENELTQSITLPYLKVLKKIVIQ